MIYLVQDALERIAPFVDGTGMEIVDDASRKKVLDIYNRVVSRLMKEGAHLSGAVREVCLPVDRQILTLDSSIQNVRNIRVYTGPGDLTAIRSQGFKYLEGGPGAIDNCCGSCLTAMEDLGDGFPLHRDLPMPMHLVAWSDRPEDADAMIRFQGADPDGREVGFDVPLKTGFPGVEQENGPMYTAGDEYTGGVFGKVSYISKPLTCGFVSVWGWLPDARRLEWLTTLRPDERTPCHRRYRLNGVPPSGMVTAQVTLRFIPAGHEEQIALIQDMDALEAMTIALGQHDKGTAEGFQNYAAFKNSGVSQLKKSKRESEGNHKKGISVKVAAGPGSLPTGSSRSWFGGWRGRGRRH